MIICQVRNKEWNIPTTEHSHPEHGQLYGRKLHSLHVCTWCSKGWSQGIQTPHTCNAVQVIWPSSPELDTLYYRAAAYNWDICWVPLLYSLNRVCVHCGTTRTKPLFQSSTKKKTFGFLDKQEDIIYISIKLEGTFRHYTNSRHSWSKSLYHQKWRMLIKEKTNNNITMFLKTKKMEERWKGVFKVQGNNRTRPGITPQRRKGTSKCQVAPNSSSPKHSFQMTKQFNFDHTSHI